jgi:lysophospholipase L1-like esterase
VTVTGVAAPAQAVTFAAPTVSEGVAPVNVTCSPASGSTLPLGVTPVTCTAHDALSRQAACSFRVTLKGLSIDVRKYSAIGDSFTEGQNGRPDPAFVDRNFVDLPNSYPTKLQMALDASYPGQGITVINRGEGGKPIVDIVESLKKYVMADKPDAVLLQGGYNDLLGDCGMGPTNTPSCRGAIARVRDGMRDGVQKAKEPPRNVPYVFVATLVPPGPLQPGAQRDRRISNDAVVQANTLIRQAVASEGGVLVDVYPLFVGHEAEYVDTDGLHLRPAGYQAMADAFFAAIQKTVPQTPLFGLTAPR